MDFVTTDIHGDQKRFHKLLEKICLRSEDTLYILGDIIDRREYGISLLFEIMAMTNVRVILGNHDAMLLAFARNGPNSRLGKLWFSNHNEHTVQDFLALDKNKKHELTDYLESLPLSMNIESSGKKYHLVHGFPSDDDFSKLWSRPTAETVSPFDDRIGWPYSYLSYHSPRHVRSRKIPLATEAAEGSYENLLRQWMDRFRLQLWVSRRSGCISMLVPRHDGRNLCSIITVPP